MAGLRFSDTTGIRREREKLGAGRWGGPLLLLIVAGVPLMFGAHFKLFPDATKPKVIVTYASLDDVPRFFDEETQDALVRYCGDPEGEVEFVGKDVEFSPTTGERCWPLTPVVLRMLRATEARERGEQAAEISRKQMEAEEAERERQLQAAAETARQAEQAFRVRYVNSSAVSQLGSGHVAITISDDGLARAIAQALRERGVSVSTNLLTNRVFDESVFSRLIAGDRTLLSRLQLGANQATLLLGRLKREPVASVGVGNSVNMRGHLTVHLVPLSGGAPVSLPTFSEAGAGFNEEQARAALFKRLAEALLEQRAVTELLGSG